jgi:hypothetical protein
VPTVARDPFKVLVAESPAPDASEAPAPPTPAPAPSQAAATVPSGNFPPTVQVDGHSVTLAGFQKPSGGDTQAVVSIDGAKFYATAGQLIEYAFKLEAIKEPCASFSHAGSPFTLCLSQTA